METAETIPIRLSGQPHPDRGAAFESESQIGFTWHWRDWAGKQDTCFQECVEVMV